MGFEPTHGDRIGLAVQRLNHSATLSQCSAVRGLRDLSCDVSFQIAFANNNCFLEFSTAASIWKNTNRNGIRTHARRPYWISSPTP